MGRGGGGDALSSVSRGDTDGSEDGSVAVEEGPVFHGCFGNGRNRLLLFRAGGREFIRCQTERLQRRAKRGNAAQTGSAVRSDGHIGHGWRLDGENHGDMEFCRRNDGLRGVPGDEFVRIKDAVGDDCGGFV